MKSMTWILLDTVKNFAPLCSWTTNPIFKRCSCTAEPSCSPPQDSLTELTTVENPFSAIAVKCQNFLHPPHRHIRAPFLFFFKEARFLLLPCFELAISLHPAFRDVRYLPFPRKAGCLQHSVFRYIWFSHQKTSLLLSHSQCQFNSCQVLLYRLQSRQGLLPWKCFHIVLILSHPAHLI